MCGISGWNLTETPNPHFVAAMAYGILERGYDSWGYFDGTETRKGTGPIIENIRAHEMLAPSAFIHTRHATTGKVTAKNSHPFTIGDITGAHNGMIHNHYDIQREHKRSLPVDSMHIFQHMVEGKPLTELEGYGAIEFYRGGKWFVASCRGDLVVAKLKNGAGVIWASTEDCLRAAAFQGEYEIETYYKIESEHVYRVETDCLYETEEVFNLSKRVDPVSIPSYSANPYGNYLGSKLDTGREKQENWWRDMISDDDLPASFTDHVTTDCTYDECEFCNEIAVLVEYQESMICKECAGLLGADFGERTKS